MSLSPQQEYEAGAAAFKAGNAAAGAEHLRNAAFAGHAEAQNQLARVYFAQLKSRNDIGSLESAAQNGDHVALFVLAMCLIEGRLLEKDSDKALVALKHAAALGNIMAENMLSQAQG